MTKKKVIVSLFILMIVSGFLFMDFKHDVPEKFRIKSFNVRLFKVGEKTSQGCYEFQDSASFRSLNDSAIYLIGVRFELEYLSLHREHLWENSYFVSGALGHIDSVEDFKIVNRETDSVCAECLVDASPFRYFHADHVDSWNGHHINQNGCFEGRIFTSLPEFVKYYNENASRYNLVNSMNDYFLFKVAPSCARFFVNRKTQLSIKLSDGEIVTRLIY